MRRIELKTRDGQRMEVSEAVGMQSEVIKNYLEEEDSSNSEPILIPLPNVRAAVLANVIQWILKKQDQLATEEQFRDWETKFVDALHLDHIYELIMAANYLDVNALLHRCCQKIADMIAGKSPEEIRETFGIPNDYTPEEEAKIRSQNAWTFESPETRTGSTSASASASGPGSTTNQ